MDTVLTSCTDAAALAAAIAHRCPQAQQHGDQWQACCPAHDDHTPSLSITPATDKVLLYCHAQCPLDAILAALGLTRRDLFVHGATLRPSQRAPPHRHDLRLCRCPRGAGPSDRPLDPESLPAAAPGPGDPWGVDLEPGGGRACPVSPPTGTRGDPARRDYLCGRGGKRRRGPACSRADRHLQCHGCGEMASRVTARPCAAPASSWCPIMTRPATSMRRRSAPPWQGSLPGAKSCPSIPTRSTVMSPTGCMPGGHGQRSRRKSRRYPGRRYPQPRARLPHRRRHPSARSRGRGTAGRGGLAARPVDPRRRGREGRCGPRCPAHAGPSGYDQLDAPEAPAETPGARPQSP